jgi:thiol:disulfide interchange protein
MRIGHFSFERVNHAGRLTFYGLVGLLLRAFAIWLGTVIIGGVVLSAANSFVAGIFGVPEFGDLRSMGFTMAGVLGFCLAAWFLVDSIRHYAEQD